MFENLADKWVGQARTRWSNARLSDSLRDYTPKTPQINSVADLSSQLKRLYPNFHYTLDDPSKGFDAMDTPPQCLSSLEAGDLKDDCDGFHAAVYYLIQKRMPSAKNVHLVTVITEPFWRSHTMCVFEIAEGGKTQRYLVNYTRVIPITSDHDIQAEVERQEAQKRAEKEKGGPSTADKALGFLGQAAAALGSRSSGGRSAIGGTFGAVLNEAKSIEETKATGQIVENRWTPEKGWQ